MGMKWTIYLLMFMIGASLIFGISEKLWLGSEEIGVLERLYSVDIGHQSGFLDQVSGFVNMAAGMVGALWDMVTFNYMLFDGAYAIVKYIFWCIGAAWLVSVVLAIRGVPSS